MRKVRLALVMGLVFAWAVVGANVHAKSADVEAADEALLALTLWPGMPNQAEVERKRSQIIREELLGGLPRSASISADELLLVQDDYLIWYDCRLRVPLWVAYRLTKAHLEGSPDRPEAFRPDPRLPEKASADLSDYAGSGFDRGHMAPDADYRFSIIARINTYILSNVCPQYPRFNRGIWAQFEKRVRDWAASFGSVYVITGALFDHNGDGRRDPDSSVKRIPPRYRVGLPTAFYKIIVRKKGTTWDALAIVLAHKPTGTGNRPTADLLTQGLTTIDAIEKKGAVDFFPGLPDAEEVRLESTRGTGLW